MKIDVKIPEMCDRVRVRKKADPATIERYAEAYKAKHILPPITVFHEPGTKRYVIADGEHRLEAAKAAGLKEIEVDCREGTEIDALEYALSCNTRHGLPRTSADAQYAYKQLRENPVLAERYVTTQDRADLLEVSVRTCQRYEADWRDKDSGSGRTETLKKEAKAHAQKFTSSKKEKPPQAPPEDDLPEDANWSLQDEESLVALNEAWDGATFEARAEFMRTH